MEHFTSFTDKPPSDYTPVKCRRMGLTVDLFSCMYGRGILRGTITYISPKNYRSNREFVAFRDANPVSLRAIVLLVDRDNVDRVAAKFNDSPGEFFNENFTDPTRPEMVIFVSRYNKFKVRKNKTFFVKGTQVLVLHGETSMLVENLTLECSCTFPG